MTRRNSTKTVQNNTLGNESGSGRIAPDPTPALSSARVSGVPMARLKMKRTKEATIHAATTRRAGQMIWGR